MSEGADLTVGKVSVKVFPDTKPFVRELRVFLTRMERQHKLEIDLEPKGEEAFTQKVRRHVRRTERRAGKVNIEVSLDHDHLDQSIQRVNRMLEDLTKTTIEVDYDKDSLEKFRKELTDLRQVSKLKLEIVEDYDGLMAARNRIQQVLRDRTKYTIEIDADEETLRRQLADLDSRIAKHRPKEKIRLEVDADRDALGRNLALITRKLNEVRHPQIEIEVDEASLRRAQRDLRERLRDVPVKIEYHDDEEGQRALLRDLNQRIRDHDLKKVLEVENDPEKLRDARDELQDIIDRYDGRKVEFKAQADAMIARRELQYTARTRFVTLVVNVSKASIARAEAALKALAGWRMLHKVLDDLWRQFKKLDKNVPLIGSVSAAIAGLSAWLLAALSNTFSLSRALAQIFGLGLLLPGIMGGFTVGIGASVAVLKDLLDVVPELRVQFRRLQDGMSSRFWAQFEAPFRRMVDVIFPEFRTGMHQTAGALGVYFTAIADEAREQLAGSMTHMFGGLTESILISSRGAENFIGIIETLGRRGADVLPRLARWWNDVTGNFNTWLKQSERSGRLDEIVETAIKNARDLGWVIYHTSGMLSGLARAAAEAGGSDLESLAAKMERIHKAVDRPAFQEGLTRALRSAHDMMDRIARTSGPQITEFFENLSYVMEYTSRDIGEAIGMLVGGIGELFSTVRFSTGFMAFWDGLRDGIEALNRMWTPLGDGLGALGSFLGTLGREFGPLLAELMIHVSDAMQRLGPYLESWAETLSGRLLSILEIVAPMMVALAEAAAWAIDPFIELTGAVEVFIIALAVSKLLAATTGVQGLLLQFAAMPAYTGFLRNMATALSTFWLALNPFARVAAIVAGLGAIVTAVLRLGEADDARALALDYDAMSFALDRAADRMATGADVLVTSGGKISDTAGTLAQIELDQIFDGFFTSAVDLTGGVDGLDAAMRNMAWSTGELTRENERLGGAYGDLGDRIEPTKKQMEEAEEAFGNMDAKIAEMAQGDQLGVARQLFDALGDSARRVGLDSEYLAEIMPQAHAAIAEGKEVLREQGREAWATSTAVDFLSRRMDDAGEASFEMMGAIQEGSLAFFDVQAAAQEAEGSLEDFVEAMKEQVVNQREWADNMAVIAKAGYGNIVDAMADLGPEHADLVAEMAAEAKKGGTKMMDDLEQAIIDGRGGAVTATEGTFSEMLSAGLAEFDALPADVKGKIAEMEPELLASMTPLGFWLTFGFGEGINEGSQHVYDAMDNANKGADTQITGFWGIQSPSRRMMGYGRNLMEGLSSGISGAVEGVLTAITTVASIIAAPFVGAGTWLVETGRGLVNGLIAGITGRSPDAGTASKGVGDTIRKEWDGSGSWLGPRGDDFVSGLVGGINRSKAGARSASTDVTKAVRNPFDPAGTWLPGRGTEAVRGLARGLSGALSMIRTATNAIRLSLVNAFQGAGSWLGASGGRAIAGLANGLRGGLSAVRYAANSARSAVIGAFGGSGGWLVGAGARIMAGLASGIASRVGAIRSQLNSLTKSIPNWKGPASTDSRLLYNAGQLIIGGLIDGLESQYAGVYQSLNSLSKGVGAVQIGGPHVALAVAEPSGLRNTTTAQDGHRPGQQPSGGLQIAFNGPVGMQPEDVAREIAWEQSKLQAQAGVAAIARGV